MVVGSQFSQIEDNKDKQDQLRVMTIAQLNWRLVRLNRQLWHAASLAGCSAGGWLVTLVAGGHGARPLGWALSLAPLVAGLVFLVLLQTRRSTQRRLDTLAAPMRGRAIPLAALLPLSPSPFAAGPAPLFSGRGIGIDPAGLSLAVEGRGRAR